MTVGKQIVSAIIVCVLVTILAILPFGGPLQTADGPDRLLEEAKRLSMLGNWHAAAPLFEQAEKLFAVTRRTREQTYARIGRIRARAQEMSQREASRLLSEELTHPLVQGDKELRLWCLMAKGAVDFNVDSAAAKQDWLEALEIARRLSEQQWTARATGELGIIEFVEGDTALAANDIGAALRSAYFGKDIGAEIEFLAIAGMGFNEEGRFDEALPPLRYAISIAEVTPDAGFPYLPYQGLGASLIARGESAEAWKMLQRALSTARIQKQHGEEGFLLILLGDASWEQGDIESAKHYFEQAGQAFMSIDFGRGLDEAMLKLANIDRNQGKLEDAAKALSIAMKVRPGMDLYYRPRAMTALAELRVAQNRFSEANTLFTAAEDMREAVLIKLHSRFEQSAMAGTMSETYLEHFRLAVRLGNVPDALRIIERIRGRASAGLLYARDSEAKESPAETALNSQINSVQRVLMETDDAQKRTILLQTLYRLEREFAVAGNESDIARPELTGEIVGIHTLQERLGKNEVLLEYVIADPASYCIAVSRNRTEIITLPSGRKRIQELVKSYVEELREKKSGSQAASDLYKVLLAPALRNFAQSRLIISPDDVLAFLPFESLRDSNSHFLIGSKTVSYVSSASQLDALRAAPSEEFASRPLLAIGDVNYTSVRLPRSTDGASFKQSILRGLEGLYRTQLPPLPESRDEVLSIAHFSTANASILLGKEATETAFKAQVADFRVIHLAVHAVSDPQYPYRASLVLGSDSQNDGLLQVREILRLRVRADLVSLSACETGIGTLQGEAGMASLVQAFLAAGAKAVVGSLWKVEDRWTSELMKEFYKRLSYEDKASALTHAKLALLNRYGDQAPYVWAGFTVWGEGSRAVSLKSN